MKKSKFTEAQIVFALKQAETGTAVEEVRRKMGIHESTFYNWKKKDGGLGVSEIGELRMFKEENSKLKQMVADLSLDKQMLQDVIKKKQLAHFLQDQCKVTIRRSCEVMMIHPSMYYYRHYRREEKPLRNRIREIAHTGVR